MMMYWASVDTVPSRRALTGAVPDRGAACLRFSQEWQGPARFVRLNENNQSLTAAFLCESLPFDLETDAR